MHSRQVPLYTNTSGSELSDADVLRRLFQEDDIAGMFELLDAASSRTPLCCVKPTSILLDAVARPWLDSLRGTLLSIGSGSGLFEMLLASRLASINPHLALVGVDTAPVDIFLNDAFKLVDDRACPIVMHVTALLAVYLRRPAILATYLEWFPHVETIVLLGPRSENPLLDPATAAAVAVWGIVAAEIDGADVASWDLCQVLRKH
ncbi:Aste57867_5951 [Aphanomyces stellatus]|uniref:Aste57867_5951 protein n=1 Tax=Aphanomyces stellatus TaxID=120398 RepID=A0A485KG29_9STRA|nr:hypothetical protein As57867_005937 [Aphanomyces stellatus]VFT82968.1 Aste57867_5951 [Aphanomyces stellatus]